MQAGRAALRLDGSPGSCAAAAGTPRPASPRQDGADLVERDFNPPRISLERTSPTSASASGSSTSRVLDCFSGRVVGWSVHADLRTELLVDALELTHGRLVHRSHRAALHGARLRPALLRGGARSQWAGATAPMTTGSREILRHAQEGPRPSPRLVLQGGAPHGYVRYIEAFCRPVRLQSTLG